MVSEWLPNPFAPGSDTPAELLVGRAAECLDVARELRDQKPLFFVTGPRGAGKTTFLSIVAQRQGLRLVRVDASLVVSAGSLSDVQASLGELWTGLVEELSWKVPAVDGAPGDVFARLAAAAKTGPLLVAVDELQYLRPEAIRAVIRRVQREHRRGGGIVWGLVLGRSWADGGHPADPAGREIFVPPLKAEDIRTLAERFSPWLPIDDQDWASIHRETAGYALFVAGLLDALYEARWEREDRSIARWDDGALGAPGLRSAAARLESSPPDRVLHALDQAGSAGRLVLRALGRDGEGSATAEEIRRRVEAEWPQWRDEVASALDGLRQNGFVAEVDGVWRITVPLLVGIVRRLSEDAITGGERPPAPEAWESFRRAEERERQGRSEEAVAAYQEAAERDPAFWPARWHLGRILAADPTRGREAASAIDGVLASLPPGARVHGEARHLLLTLLARDTAEQAEMSPRRRALVERIRQLDPGLLHEDARRVVLATVAAKWVDGLKGTGTQARPADRFREALREVGAHADALCEAIAFRLAAALAVDPADSVAVDHAVGLLSSVVPMVWLGAQDTPGGASLASAGGALAARRLLAGAPGLSADAWEVAADWVQRDLSPALAAAHGLALGPTTDAEAALRGEDWVAFRRLAVIACLPNLSGSRESFLDFVNFRFTEGFPLGVPGEWSARAEPFGTAVCALLGSPGTSEADREDLADLTADFLRHAVGGLTVMGVEGESAWRLLIDWFRENLPGHRTAPAFAKGGAAERLVDSAAPAAAAGPEVDLPEDERLRIEDGLEGLYEVIGRDSVRSPALRPFVAAGQLQAWHGRERVGPGEPAAPVLIREYRFRGSPEQVGLLRTMWDNERRALLRVSLSAQGRGLVRYKHSREFPEHRSLLVTERVGRALSTYLTEFPPSSAADTFANRVGRSHFWGHVTILLEALEALHANAFFHRAFRPDALYVQVAPEEWRLHDPRVAAVLRLGNLELSVYLRQLGVGGLSGAGSLDRYVAPESLRARLGVRPDGPLDDRGPIGETQASDYFGLGLVLFECLVRPLTAVELGRYPSRAAYGRTEEAEHQTWLEQTLIGEAKRRVGTREVDLLEQEVQLLEELLAFHPANRPALRSLMKRIGELCVRGDGALATEPLPLFTKLEASDGGDPRNDPASLVSFLRNDLEEVELASMEPAEWHAWTVRLVEAELLDAEVFLNQRVVGVPVNWEAAERPGAAPLLLRSKRSGVWYRVWPFIWEEDDESREWIPQFGYLEVARRHEGDAPMGPPMALLTKGVSAYGVTKGVLRQQRAEWARRQGWKALLDAARDMAKDQSADLVASARREGFWHFLDLSVRAERDAIWQEAPFEKVSAGAGVLKGPAGTNLAVAVEAMLVEDLFVEILRDGPSRGVACAIRPEDLDPEHGLVHISGLEAASIPDRGVIRASSTRGTAALFRRRRKMVEQIGADRWLLDIVTAPARHTIRVDNRPPPHPLLPDLDKEKRDILHAWEATRGLLVCQGPPGTGKTTLATEIILNTLRHERNARVLVSTGGHEPLDNVLERLAEEARKNEAVRRIWDSIGVVRVPSGRERRWSAAVERHFPHRRAEEAYKRLMSRAKELRAGVGLAAVVGQAVLHHLRAYSSAPASLRTRILRNANLVFATTNAREIQEAEPLSFDMVLVEEAARSVPIEVVGPMRLARRALLIGDQEQLPPFSAKVVAAGVAEALDELVKAADRSLAAAEGERGARVARRGALSARLDQLRFVQASADGWMKLFGHLHNSNRRKEGIPGAAEDAPQSQLLTTQWRMHPEIASIVSKVFYDGKAVRNPTDREEYKALAARRVHPILRPASIQGKQVVWVDFDPARTDDQTCAEQRSRAGQLENVAERRTMVGFLRQVETRRKTDDIAILSPYRTQVEQMRGLCEPSVNTFNGFEVPLDRISTVDAFQGRQAGVVLVSLVRNNPALPSEERMGVGFLAEKSRSTVLFSRAERLLVVFGCVAHFRRFASTRYIVDIHDAAHERYSWRDFLMGDEISKAGKRSR